MTVAHTELQCTLPSGVGFFVEVKVERGSQTALAPLVSYAGPSFTAGTLRFAGSAPTGTPSHIRTTSTAGGEMVEIGRAVWPLLVGVFPDCLQTATVPLGSLFTIPFRP